MKLPDNKSQIGFYFYPGNPQPVFALWTYATFPWKEKRKREKSKAVLCRINFHSSSQLHKDQIFTWCEIFEISLLREMFFPPQRPVTRVSVQVSLVMLMIRPHLCVPLKQNKPSVLQSCCLCPSVGCSTSGELWRGSIAANWQDLPDFRNMIKSVIFWTNCPHFYLFYLSKCAFWRKVKLLHKCILLFSSTKVEFQLLYLPQWIWKMLRER